MARIYRVAALAVVLGGLWAGCGRPSADQAPIVVAPSDLIPEGSPGASGQIEPPSTTGGPSDRAADYFPLLPGSRWEYEVTYTLPLVGSHPASAVATLAAPRTVGSRVYQPLSTKVSGVPMNADKTELYRGTDAGFCRIDATDASADMIAGKLPGPEILFLPATLAKGKKWIVPDKRGIGYATVAGHESVCCLGTTYPDCIHIHVEALGGDAQLDRWLARGVGLVRSETCCPAITLTVVLKRFDRP